MKPYSAELDKSTRSCQDESFNTSDITLDSQDEAFDTLTGDGQASDLEVVLFRGLPDKLINCVRLLS